MQKKIAPVQMMNDERNGKEETITYSYICAINAEQTNKLFFFYIIISSIKSSV